MGPASQSDDWAVPTKWSSLFRGTRALDRVVLKRTPGRDTIHFTADSGNIERMPRTMHSANQPSIHGAVSSWCDEFPEQLLGQTSVGADKSVSKMNEQLTRHLDPQEVVFLVQNQRRTEEARAKLLAWSLATIRDAGPWRTVSYNLWISWIHKTSLCWNVLQNRWWCERWMWKSHSVMQRV